MSNCLKSEWIADQSQHEESRPFGLPHIPGIFVEKRGATSPDWDRKKNSGGGHLSPPCAL
jgi:hypothetical protein